MKMCYNFVRVFILEKEGKTSAIRYRENVSKITDKEDTL